MILRNCSFGVALGFDCFGYFLVKDRRVKGLVVLRVSSTP